MPRKQQEFRSTIFWRDARELGVGFPISLDNGGKR
jgi:hypothetical protein